MKDGKHEAHGYDVFGVHWNCRCHLCCRVRESVRDLVNSFSKLPDRWIEIVARHDDIWLPLPMWGTLFVPGDDCDARNIARLCRETEPSDSEEEVLLSAGWRKVGTTGILAVEFDDQLLLGINGAGYDFYEAHWNPLYVELEYSWHEA